MSLDDATLSADDAVVRPFSPPEIARLHTAVREAARQLDDPGLVAVGLGVKEAGGRRQKGAPLAARFYVRHKRHPRPASRRVPDFLSLILQRDDGTCRPVRLPTDVQATGGTLEFTGTTLTTASTAVTGLTIRWLPVARGDRSLDWQWGLLTVGHICAGPEPDCAAVVRRRDHGPYSPESIRSRIAYRAHADEPFDAAIVPFSFLELSLSGFAPDATAMVALRNEVQLLHDARVKADVKALPPTGAKRPRLRVKSFHPLSEGETLAGLRQVVMVEGQPGDFAPGTSGTVWLINGVPAAMQVAAFAPDYRLGVGQSLLGCLMHWARPVLSAELIVAVHAF